MKKESSSNVNKRVKKYREKNKKIEIVGLSEDEKKQFQDLKGLDNLSYANKLKLLIKIWENHYLKFNNEILDFEYKELDKLNSKFFSDFSINKQEIIDFIEKNNISPKLISTKLDKLNEIGMNMKYFSDYLIHIKKISENLNNTNIPSFFIENIENRVYLSDFVEKLENEKIILKEESIQQKKYLTMEVQKAEKYLRNKNELFLQLLNEYKSIHYDECFVIQIFSNILQPKDLIGNKLIIKKLLPYIQKQKDYPYIAFDDWKNNKLKK